MAVIQSGREPDHGDGGGGAQRGHSANAGTGAIR